MNYFKIFFLLFIVAFDLFAQVRPNNRHEEIQRQIEQMMKARDEMLRSLLNDDAFSTFDKRFEDLIKEFERNSFSQGLMPEAPIIGEYDWKETDTHKILSLKVKQIKDKPLNIKIEKGMIILKGDVESIEEDSAKKNKRISKVHFERSFSIPDGVDQTTPEFENKDGELLIKFKKTTSVKKVHPKKALPDNPPEKLEPLMPSESDAII